MPASSHVISQSIKQPKNLNLTKSSKNLPKTSSGSSANHLYIIFARAKGHACPGPEITILALNGLSNFISKVETYCLHE